MKKAMIYALMPRRLPVFVFIFSTILESSRPETVNIVWMAPMNYRNKYDELKKFDISVSSNVASLALALTTVSERQLFGDREINVTWVNSNCTSQTSIGKLVDLMYTTRVDFILGPPCTEAMVPVADLAAYKNIPNFSWSPNSKLLDNTKRFRTVLKTFSPTSNLASALAINFDTWNWKRFVMISAKSLIVMARSLESVYEFYDSIKLVHHYSNRDDHISEEAITEIYKTVRREARIIFFVVPKSELRKYLLVADDMGMTDGEYQFIFSQYQIPYKFVLDSKNGNSLWKRGDGRDDEARRAYSSLLYITLGGSELTNFSKEASAALESEPWKSRFAHLPAAEEPDAYSPFLHDAVMLFGLAYNQTQLLQYEPNGVGVLATAERINFKGKTGDVLVSPSNSRSPRYWMFSMDRDGEFKLVFSLGEVYIRELNQRKFLVNHVSNIIWGNGREYNGSRSSYLPPDTPACGFEGELCSTSAATTTTKAYDIIPIIAPSIISGILLVIGILVAFMYKKMQFERDLANMSWKISRSSLNFCFNKKARNHIGSTNHLRASVYSLPSHCDSIDVCNQDQASLAGSLAGVSMLAAHHYYVTVAVYKNNLVAVKRLRKKKIAFDRHMQMEMKMIFELKNSNIASFVGVSVEGTDICVLWEYCNKGSIQDVVENENLRLDNMFKLSLMADVCTGLEFIQSSPLKVHGRLKSSNCIIDSRWVCKLTDFGMRFMYEGEEDDPDGSEFDQFSLLFWTAPEILREMLDGKSAVELTQEGDVYSYGVILKELFCRCRPYSEQDAFTAKDIIYKIAYPDSESMFRPSLIDAEIDPNGKNKYIVDLAVSCWSEEPLQRPPLKNIRKILDKVNPYKKTSVVDNMIMMMEKYSYHLEDLVADRTEKLQEEKKKTDALLYRMLPRSVAEDLKLGKPVQAETYEAVTIYFSDIVSFTTLAGNCTPIQVVQLLNSLYTLFDDIISKYDVYKVETIGDAYMIVSGLPERNGDRHVTQMADVSLHLISGVLDFQVPHLTNERLQIRIGLHTGPVVSGVVGLTMPRYCLFGDSVNTASRMESSGKPMRIHISSFTYSALSIHSEYSLLERGYIDVKGKGKMKTYWLVGKEGFEHALPPCDHTPMLTRKESEPISVSSFA